MGVVVEKLSFSYPNKIALKNISFNIDDGEFLGLVGPTGCGKTTLALCMNGLIPNSIKGKFSGRVLIDGLDTRKHKVSELARKVGLVFQDPDWQIFNLTVEDEVVFGLRNLSFDKIKKRVREALKIVGLNGLEKEEPQRLSQGQKQKLCVASVIATDPDFIVLDEPTSQLDYKNTLSIHEILKKLNKKGKIILMIEHDTDFLAKYANRVLIMEDGRIIRDGETDEVFSKVRFLKKLGIKIPRVYDESKD
ncbi:MAG: ABC transporter ATP-binding protein [Candidatus Aenigmarchaeota archaeon]|nr:ABC transporter ATP-binding protein [Candidatus Aenigmarchaeota archaeon]